MLAFVMYLRFRAIFSGCVPGAVASKSGDDGNRNHEPTVGIWRLA